MKNLLLVLLLFVSSLATAQVVDTVAVNSNPALVSIGDTDITMIDVNRESNVPRLSMHLPKLLTVLIKFPSTNVGTVQVSTMSDVVTVSPAFAADTYLWITINDRFWIKLSNAADDFEISW